MINPQITIPRKISGYRSRVINGLIDCLENTRRALAKLNKPEFVITEDLNFRVDLYSSTSVRVHGGKLSRRAMGVQTTVNMTVDSGTPGTFDSTKTITGLGASNGFIILTLNIFDDPTTLSATFTDTYPATDLQSLVRVVAAVTVAAGSITKVEQLHLGDIEDRLDIPDAYTTPAAQGSLEYHELTGYRAWQIYAFHDASDTLPVEDLGGSDLLMFRQRVGAGAVVNYCGPSNVASYVQGYIDFDTPVDSWMDGNFETWALANHSHANHTNLVAPADDHTQYWLLGAAYSRNYGSSIGDTDGNREIINLEGLELKAGVISGTSWSVPTGNFDLTEGSITLTAGSIGVALGDINVDAGAILVDVGDITATAGDIIASAGAITATLGDIIADAGNLAATLGTVTAGAGYYHGLIGPFVSMYLSDASETTQILGYNAP